MSIPALIWRFTAEPHLSSDLNFIMEELDRFYNQAIKLAKNLAALEKKDTSGDTEGYLYLLHLGLLSKATWNKKEKKEKQQFISVGTVRMFIETSAKH